MEALLKPEMAPIAIGSAVGWRLPTARWRLAMPPYNFQKPSTQNQLPTFTGSRCPTHVNLLVTYSGLVKDALPEGLPPVT